MLRDGGTFDRWSLVEDYRDSISFKWINIYPRSSLSLVEVN
jgi:hypothetical protein